MKKIIIENIKTIIYALIIAVLIRSILLQPFYIPSSSMEPNLLVGDRLFVTKYTYGYSKHSLPFSPPIFKNRIFSNDPERGDVAVFKTPADNRTDYIKRVIGLPGDTIQFIDGDLYLNGNQILKTIKLKKWDKHIAANLNGPMILSKLFYENLPKNKNGDIINIIDQRVLNLTPHFLSYTISKSALWTLTRTLALELAPKIKVNAIAPETTETIQVQPKKAIAEKYHDHIERWNPYGRFGKPSDAAGSALFLASDLSSWVTGATINLDGGALAAAGWYRDPDNSWTIAPVISDDGFNYK